MQRDRKRKTVTKINTDRAEETSDNADNKLKTSISLRLQ